MDEELKKIAQKIVKDAGTKKLTGEIVDKTPPGAKKADQSKRKHRRPSEFDDSEWAREINEMLDAVDPAPEGSKFANPATRFRVGQSAAATAAELTESPDLDIHPGYLLCFAMTAYLIVIAIHFLGERTKEKPAAAADAGQDEKEGSKFAGLL